MNVADFADSRFLCLENNSRAQRIGIVSSQLHEIEELCRANPRTAAYQQHDLERLRAELRELRKPAPPRQPAAGFVATCVVLLPLALISVVSLVRYFIHP
ncbi:hypothetical protein [Variovorax sp. GT1P44]|uniref:hypothetical protein n=1 Tax=Variovorax sp. GT1P44 TaxID=3443742 RepID=UPI003F448309